VVNRTPEPESDEALMLAYQAGETRAFAQLLERHRRPIFNFLVRSVGDPVQAEDLLQDVFMRVVRGAEGYQRQAKFTTWLYTIARNLCVDAQRRGKFRKTSSLDAPGGGGSDGEEGSPLLDRIADGQLGTERQAIGRELRGKLEQAIARLPADQREVFLMREMSGMPFKDIADVVGCPENTIKSRMRYALERLREELEEYRDLAQAAG
jgi:RNA polymerase sigma-70 factor (ECF subfamily)